MKIQTLGLTLAATTLCFAPAAQSEVINNQFIKPVIDVQVNQAVNKNNFVQGSAQSSNLFVNQASVVAPGSISLPKIDLKLPGGSKILAPSYAAPVVVVNTIVAPTVQVQANIAANSKNGVQGGTQLANTNANQNVLVTGGKGADNTYVYNTSYTPVYQYQYNYAAYSKGVVQGGATGVVNNLNQNTTVVK
jgi:hypothetical protein